MKLFYKTILLFAFIIAMSATKAEANTLSDRAEMYLITATPGDELYSIFGHSAIWVVDPVAGIDNVYNYGTFNFNTPNFYIKFIRGKLHYMLSVGRMDHFLFEYHMTGRGVVQQKLNLKQNEMQEIFEFLEVNRKPENKEYLYDFFFDNCATRIRDVFDDLLQINWHDYPFDFEPKTFRELVKDYVENLPWEHFGIDFLLGYPVDRIATPYEYMFLPDHMHVAFGNAMRSNGEPLVVSEQQVLPKKLKDPEPGLLTPFNVLWALCALFFIGMLYATTRKSLAKSWMFLMGFGGLALLPIFIFTDHVSFNPNMNFLWAMPLNLFFIFKSGKKWAQKYFKYITLLTIILAVFFLWLPQKYNPAVFPVLLMIIMSSAYLAYRNPKQKDKI